MYHILYNPLACSDKGHENAKKVVEFIKGEHEFTDITKVNYSKFLPKITDEDTLVICGGDGTLNHFVNDIDCVADLDLLVFEFAHGDAAFGLVADIDENVVSADGKNLALHYFAGLEFAARCEH